MTRRPDWADPEWEPTDEQLLAMTAGVITKPKREPAIFRLARENAEAIRNMGKDAIAEAHRLGVSASYASRELGEGIVRETPDGIRHLERKINGEWVEVATFPPREDWVDPTGSA